MYWMKLWYYDEWNINKTVEVTIVNYCQFKFDKQYILVFQHDDDDDDGGGDGNDDTENTNNSMMLLFCLLNRGWLLYLAEM